MSNPYGLADDDVAVRIRRAQDHIAIANRHIPKTDHNGKIIEPAAPLTYDAAGFVIDPATND